MFDSLFDLLGIILGGFMLYGLIRFMNGEREKEGKNPLGCISIIIISIVVITFWVLTSR